MKKFIINIVKLLFPFGLILFSIILIDPFDYFQNDFVIKRENKKMFSTNEVLSKLIGFRSNPNENIILGDSRAMLLEEESIRTISGMSFANLSYGAGNLNEALSTFVYIKNRFKISNVLFCMNIESYNKANIRNRVESVISILNNPLLYFTNYNVLQASFYIMKYILINSKTEINTKPNLSKEDFWIHQLSESATRYYSNYIYPDILKQKLSETASFCKANKVAYAFVIMPTHIDLQNKLVEFNLDKKYKRFLSDLEELGTVYDFNFENEFTINKNNFKDPFHADNSKIFFVIEKIFKNINTDYCKQSGKDVRWN